MYAQVVPHPAVLVYRVSRFHSSHSNETRVLWEVALADWVFAHLSHTLWSARRRELLDVPPPCCITFGRSCSRGSPSPGFFGPLVQRNSRRRSSVRAGNSPRHLPFGLEAGNVDYGARPSYGVAARVCLPRSSGIRSVDVVSANREGSSRRSSAYPAPQSPLSDGMAHRTQEADVHALLPHRRTLFVQLVSDAPPESTGEAPPAGAPGVRLLRRGGLRRQIVRPLVRFSHVPRGEPPTARGEL